MALQRDTLYAGRFNTATTAHPQGAFKNRTTPTSQDGSYLEEQWLNDWDGFFASLLSEAGLTPDGNVDGVGASQYFNALKGVATQPGALMYYAASSAPSGWLKANGAAVSRTVYAKLFAAIGTQFGAGDGFNTFNLPDLRGEFIRGWDDARGIDGGRTFGSWQKGTLVCGYDDTSDALNFSILPGPVSNYGGDKASDVSYGLSDIRWGYVANQTIVTLSKTDDWLTIARPRNVALLACIKY